MISKSDLARLKAEAERYTYKECPACRYSGNDEAEYRAYGCPDCNCMKLEPKTILSILAALEDCKQVLGIVKKWGFCTDGRKFNGNHKLVVKEITRLAKEVLFKHFSEEKSEPQKEFDSKKGSCI